MMKTSGHPWELAYFVSDTHVTRRSFSWTHIVEWHSRWMTHIVNNMWKLMCPSVCRFLVDAFQYCYNESCNFQPRPRSQLWKPSLTLTEVFLWLTFSTRVESSTPQHSYSTATAVDFLKQFSKYSTAVKNSCTALHSTSQLFLPLCTAISLKNTEIRIKFQNWHQTVYFW